MATVFTANSSSVLVDGEPILGVRGIDYRLVRQQEDVFALGSDERVAVYYGPSRVQGRIQVASANPTLDGIALSGESFQIVSNLRHGQAARSVAFDECYIQNKEFSLLTGGHGETVYTFTATRVREEDEGGAG